MFLVISLTDEAFLAREKKSRVWENPGMLPLPSELHMWEAGERKASP